MKILTPEFKVSCAKFKAPFFYALGYTLGFFQAVGLSEGWFN